MGMHHEAFEHELEALKGEKGVTNDTDLTAEDLKELVERSKKVYEKFGKSFPLDPLEQMKLAVFAVFDSWQSDRAILYREVEKIQGLAGTAVNIQ
eukprot:1196192-Prorocentrum_minimum.AAC.9